MRYINLRYIYLHTRLLNGVGYDNRVSTVTSPVRRPEQHRLYYNNWISTLTPHALEVFLNIMRLLTCLLKSGTPTRTSKSRRAVQEQGRADLLIMAWVVSMQYQLVTDRRTDGRTDMPTVTTTALA